MLLLSGAGASQAQEVRASISGIVTDPSGAAVSGAAIHVTNSSTNSTVSTRTNESGSYLTPFLAPGTYILSVEQAGFKKLVRENIVLESLDKARIDVQLQLGAIADAVTVTAAVSMLQTETASRGQTLSKPAVQQSHAEFCADRQTAP
jgi:hypothetical protein